MTTTVLSTTNLTKVYGSGSKRFEAFTPVSILTVLLVMGIAFIAAVLPASRAARQSPIDSLRYE